LDSMVRVQAGRLRSKLAEYYSSEGAGDPTIIEVPKGSYAVAIHERANAPAINGHAEIHHNGASSANVRKGWVFAVVGLSLALTVAIVLLARDYLAHPGSAGSTAQASALEPPTPVRIFWKGFATEPDEPWVIFSNAAFVGRPETGMRYFDA